MNQDEKLSQRWISSLSFTSREATLFVLQAYCFLVPFFLPIPVGPVEIGIMDLLLPVSLALILLNRKIRLSVPLLALLLYTGIVFVSVIWIQDLGARVGAFLRAIRFFEIVIPFVLATSITIYPEDIKKFVYSFIWGGGISLGIGLILFLLQISPGPIQKFYFFGITLNRAGGIFSDSSAFGHLVATWLAIALLFLPMYAPNRKVTRWSLYVAGIGLLAFLASYSRSALIFLFVVGLFYILTKIPRIWKKEYRQVYRAGLYILGAMGIIFLLMLVLFPTRVTAFIQLTFERFVIRTFGFIWAPENIDRISSGRISNWLNYLPFVQENPITGIGYKALKLERGVPPDNNYLAALVETGVLGLLFLLTFFISTIYTFLKGFLKNNALAWVLFLMWMGQVAMALVIDIMTFWGTMPAVMVITASVMEMKKESYHKVRIYEL